MNEFFNWLNNIRAKKSDTRLASKKEKQFHEMKSIWEESAKLNMPDAPDNQQEWIKLQRAIRIAEDDKEKKSFGLFKLFSQKPQFAVAVSFAIVAIFVITIFMYPKKSETIYASANMEKKSVILTDGTIVKLNSGSRIIVSENFSKDSRNLSLQGEAYFEVKKGPIPFQIQTEIGVVTVLGTKFNIKSRNDIMEVAVNEGVVKVTSTVSQKDSSIILTKGQLSLCDAGKYPAPPQSIGFNEYPDWLYNKLILRETELSIVLEEIERRFDIKIIQNDEKLNQLKISGLFEASDLDSLVSSLCFLIQKEYSLENKTINIY